MHRVKQSFWGLCVALGCGGALSTAEAEALGREQIVAFLQQPAPQSLPAAGTVLHQPDMAVVKQLLPPGYAEEFDFPQMEMEIQATSHYQPHQCYRDATEKFAGQAQIGADGALENYTAGLPFSPAQIDGATPDQAGLMIAWNRVYRWQYFGWNTDLITMSYLRPTADGRPGKLTEGHEGGGYVDRYVTQNYHRVYLNHLAMFPEKGYKVKASNSDTRLFKDYIEFYEPYDVAGTRFITERSLDPHEEDQISSFLPSQRRVRRLSAQERADGFMGSDMNMDDFEGFSGRVLDWSWTYLGKRQVLHVTDAKSATSTFFGPMSRVPHERWQVRQAYVVEIKSKWEGHPYASKIMFLDAETYNCIVALAFDRKGEVWRMFSAIYNMTPNIGDPSVPIERSVPFWNATIAIDRINQSATVARANKATTMPTMTETQIESIFNVSKLTEGRR